MLWYKAWLDTRWRFAIGLVILMLSGCAAVLGYPEAVKALAHVSQIDGESGRPIYGNAALIPDYRGYVWSVWFRQTMRELWALFAVLSCAIGGLAEKGTPMLTRKSREASGARGAACLAPLTPEQAENRGLAWVIGAFLICPCHLPLTLGLATTLLAGTAAGVLLRTHLLAAGILVTTAWVAGTWRGIHHLRAARRYATSRMRLQPREEENPADRPAPGASR
jgi:hypothetical protein